MEISGKAIWFLITAVLLAILFISTAEAQQRFQRQQRFRPNNNNNFNFRRNNNNGGGGRGPPQGQNGFAFGLDTSDGRYARFDGPVRGIPPGHGGGRFGAADCLLCGK